MAFELKYYNSINKVGQEPQTQVGVHGLENNTFSPGGILFSFSNHTFTPGTNTVGRDGPTLTELQSAYSSTSWVSNTDYFNVVSGVQLFKIPETASYTIQAAGSRGGQEISNYGQGRIVNGTADFNKNDVLAIIVGQEGRNRGGGGGTYVWYWGASISSSTPGTQNLIIAAGGGGGGGAGAASGTPQHAPTSESAVAWFGLNPSSYVDTNSPATDGNGGFHRDNTGNYWDPHSGAGWNSSGAVQNSGGNTPAQYYTNWGVSTSAGNLNTTMAPQHPKSTVAPGRGGIGWYVNAGTNPDGAGAGGFGGGGGQGGDINSSLYGVGGGGGGYSGGVNGGNYGGSGANRRTQGGGAGSYLTSSPYLSNTSYGGLNNSHGYVELTKV